MTAPPFPYFGSKQSLAARIVDLLPPHRHYVEPFAGSLAVLLAKPAAPMETVNDLWEDLVTFWRILRDRPQDLARVVALTPHSRAEHAACRDRDAVDDLERARRVFVQLTQGRSAVGVRSGWRNYVTPAGGTGMPDYLLGYLRRITAAAERLQHVTLECRPALDMIDRYGRDPDVLLYVDPPYLGSSRSTPQDLRRETRRYAHEMLDEAAHRELGAALLDCRAAVVLSGYPSGVYDQLYDGWARVEFAARTGQSATGEWSTRTEVLWSNRPLASAASLFDVGEVS